MAIGEFRVVPPENSNTLIFGRFRAQVGDSIIVTEQGYEPLTSHPKSLGEVVVG